MLVPVLAAGAILIWRRDPGREVFGGLVGSTLLPLILLTRETPCLASGPCASDPATNWLYASAALLLAGTGCLLMTSIRRPGGTGSGGAKLTVERTNRGSRHDV